MPNPHRELTIRYPLRRASLVCVAAAVALVLAGCGGTAQTVPGDTSSSVGAAGFPVELDNCGRKVHFDKPPSRAVALDQIATEVMLGLGLEKQMVGTAYLTNPIAPDLAASYATVPVLAEQYPSTEVLLGAAPDVIIGNLDTYTFDEKVGRSRDSLESKGIKTYVLQCGSEKATFDLMYQRYQELGRIFGVGDKADQFVQGIQDSLAATAAKLDGAPPTTTFIYQKGTAADGGATTAGGGGIFNAVVMVSGGKNIFDDRPSFPLPVVSFETVADRNPQTIVIVDISGTSSPADKQQFLADQPGLQAVSAIQNKRFFVMQFIDFGTGPRIQETVARMGKFLHPSRF